MEHAVVFGPNDALVGILNDPADRRPDAPVVLFTNAGVLPRQGPHRINVSVARALAKEGIPSLRFDLSGHGDSLSIANTAGIRPQSVLDLKSAMDLVQRQIGISRFYVFGVCSSAVNAYDIALADERVAGILMFDGFWYRSRWTTAIRNVKRAVNANWRQRITAVRRRLVPGGLRDAAAAAPLPAGDALVIDTATFGNPPLATFADAMQRLVDRGVNVFLVYGGSVIDQYSYAGQFRDVFGAYPFSSRVRCEFHPDVDHTFITRHAQSRMIDVIRSWAVGQGVAR